MPIGGINLYGYITPAFPAFGNLGEIVAKFIIAHYVDPENEGDVAILISPRYENPENARVMKPY